MPDEICNARFPNFDEPTDMEIAMHLSRLLDDSCSLNVDRAGWKESLVSMARHVLNSMTNPYARKLLTDQIGE
jgi:hypothetical protein